MDFAVSPTLAINEKVRQMAGVYNFGLGQSPFPVIPSMVRELKENAHQKDYLAVQGLEELREEIATFHKRKDGLTIDANQLLIGPGSKELLFSLLFCFDAHVIIPTPCWVTYIPQCKMTGRKVSLVHCDYSNGWKLTPDLLRETLEKIPSEKEKLLILNYPNNPTGSTYNQEEIKAICEICNTFHVSIVSDEIYGLINHQGNHVTSALYSDLSIIASGISKWAGAGGWRLGYMVFPKKHLELLDTMRKMVSETYTSVSAPIQYAAIEAFKSSVEVNVYLTKAKKTLALLAKKIENVLGKNAEIRLSKMEGGFYFFLDATRMKSRLATKNIFTSDDLADFLLEKHHIASLPGSCFGRSPEELSLRFSFVEFNGAALMEYDIDALNDEVIDLHCVRVTEGVKKLKEILFNF